MERYTGIHSNKHKINIETIGTKPGRKTWSETRNLLPRFCSCRFLYKNCCHVARVYNKIYKFPCVEVDDDDEADANNDNSTVFT